MESSLIGGVKVMIRDLYRDSQVPDIMTVVGSIMFGLLSVMRPGQTIIGQLVAVLFIIAPLIIVARSVTIEYQQD